MEKLVCAYLCLVSEKYQNSFELKNLLFSAQELIDKANSLFDDTDKTIELLDLQNTTKGIGSATTQKFFVRGSQDSLNDYFRLATPSEVQNYNVNELVNKILPFTESYQPQNFIRNNTSYPNLTTELVYEYFGYIRNNSIEIQITDNSLSSREAVWIAAAVLTYNEFIRTNSIDIEQYSFSQNTIAKLANTFNPQMAMATCSQVVGQMVTQGKNNQNYSYLIPVGDKRRVAATNEDEKTKPEQLKYDFKVNTISGSKSVKEIVDFIELRYTPFIKSNEWKSIPNMKTTEISNGVSDKIHFILEKYKRDFEKVDKDERYKWEAVKWYKDHWDISAIDFGEMVTVAFEKAANLLTAGMYYAYKMLVDYSKAYPEKARSLFKILYDEEISLEQRYSDFQNEFKDYIKELQKETGKTYNHYQDLHAISVYLSFEYPEKYFIYKYKMYKSVKDKIGFVEEKKSSIIGKIENYSRMCELILKEINEDDELKNLSSARLNGECYKDPEYHILTIDIVFYGYYYLQNDITENKDEDIMDYTYWPDYTEYDPEISPEEWESFLAEDKKDYPSTLKMLKCMLDFGGEMTCKQLSRELGGHPSAYVARGNFLGQRAKKKFELPPCMDGDIERFFPVAFVGRHIVENGKKYYSWKLRTELAEALKNMNLDNMIFDESVTDVKLNTILYGPPGTGKTYNTVRYAVAIIENRELKEVEQEDYSEVFARYNQYKNDGRIAFTTFHQSYGYEEFIEGIKPLIIAEEENEGKNDISYSVMPGVFKSFCEKSNMAKNVASITSFEINDNPSIWKVSLERTGENPTRSECLEKSHIRIGWDSYGKDITDETDFSSNGGKNPLNAFINRMRIGDIVLSCYSATTIDAVGVVTGEYEWHDEYHEYKRLRKVDWLVKNIREDIMELTHGTTMTLSSVYRFANITLNDVLKIVEKYKPSEILENAEKGNYVFIIDEINRGNISKIFGELITLIEPSKRLGADEEAQAVLPYSCKAFGVPGNVYIIGTMNTADRSIAAIDTALRRRFFFKEILPDPEVLKDVYVEDICISEMLSRMNKRIEVLYDREHTIGHAYFMALKDSPTIDTLAEIFENNIIPLLQEYFYEDYEKIRLVLGDNQKEAESQFVVAKPNDYAELFGSVDVDLDEGRVYEINKSTFDNIEAYRSI